MTFVLQKATAEILIPAQNIIYNDIVQAIERYEDKVEQQMMDEFDDQGVVDHSSSSSEFFDQSNNSSS